MNLSVDPAKRRRALMRALSDLESFSRYVLERPLRRYQMEPARAIAQSALRGQGETFAVMMPRQVPATESLSKRTTMLMFASEPTEAISSKSIRAAPSRSLSPSM